MSLDPGSRLGHYVLRATLGAGGMGEVFRATDTKLGRAVALKVLPSDMARDPERLARFQREARAIAALNHPHIVTIYSVDEIDGIHFLTMELIEGESLAQLIPDAGLAVDRTLAIGMELADALAAAHDKGIVHRDLKPANVMMTADGRVKVLDFGLAKELRPAAAVDASTDRRRTHRDRRRDGHAGLHVARAGRRAADGSPDGHLFARHPALSDGERPAAVRGRDVDGARVRHSARRAAAAHRDSIRRPRRSRTADSALPRKRRAAPRADRARRGQRAARHCRIRGAETAHRAGAVAATKGARPVFEDDGFWVAVLPFKYSGGNPDVGALVEGLSEEIVTGLSKFSYLRVMARAADQKVTARYVMDGSVRQAGSQLRLTVQLVDAATGAHLWAETYDRPFQPASDLRAAGRSHSPHHLDVRGYVRRARAEHQRGRPQQGLQPAHARTKR